MLRNQKGFTLMELMIVIVIIGVLAAIGVPAYRGYIARANKGVCKANRRSLETAIQLYRMDSNLDAPPDDIAVDATTVGAYIDNWADFDCPDGGTYNVDGNWKITCTVATHND